ncbi:MAG: kelch repeat-containing protein, partial [Anaerolineaceae bacterium]
MLKSNDLSDRERDILKLVATGVSNKEIARELHISTNTVKVHLRNIFAKINVYSRTEATLYAIEHGIVDTPGNQEVQDGSNAFIKETISSRRRWIYLSVIALIILTTSYITWYSLQSKKNSTPAPLSSIATPTNQPRWQKHAPLPEGRAGMAAAVYENQIYLFAGETKNGITNTALKYDIDTDQWHSIANKPTPVTDIQAAMIGEKIYIPGGETTQGITSRLEVYDPRSDTWEQKAQLPSPCSAYSLTALDGKLYLFGGWNGKDYLNVVYIYNPEEDAWEQGTGMPTARAYAMAGVVNGKIFIIGGLDNTGSLTINESYLPNRDRAGDQPWTEQLPLPEDQVAYGMQSLGDVLFVVCKSKTGQYSILQFLPQNSVWTYFDKIAPTFIGKHFAITAYQGFL